MVGTTTLVAWGFASAMCCVAWRAESGRKGYGRASFRPSPDRTALAGAGILIAFAIAILHTAGSGLRLSLQTVLKYTPPVIERRVQGAHDSSRMVTETAAYAHIDHVLPIDVMPVLFLVMAVVFSTLVWREYRRRKPMCAAAAARPHGLKEAVPRPCTAAGHPRIPRSRRARRNARHARPLDHAGRPDHRRFDQRVGYRRTARRRCSSRSRSRACSTRRGRRLQAGTHYGARQAGTGIGDRRGRVLGARSSSARRCLVPPRCASRTPSRCPGVRKDEPAKPIALVGHSQGAVICAWFIRGGHWQEKPSENYSDEHALTMRCTTPLTNSQTIALFTCGSPLGSLYRTFFPRYFNETFFIHGGEKVVRKRLAELLAQHRPHRCAGEPRRCRHGRRLSAGARYRRHRARRTRRPRGIASTGRTAASRGISRNTFLRSIWSAGPSSQRPRVAQAAQVEGSARPPFLGCTCTGINRTAVRFYSEHACNHR